MGKEIATNVDNGENEKIVIGEAAQFRNQALCIKTNIQILSLMWELNPRFKELKTGCFYKTVQDNCIFRIVLETYKLLYDDEGNSKTILGMANDCYRKMTKIERMQDKREELLKSHREFKRKVKKYTCLLDAIKKGRNEIYAHNDQNHHWFEPSYLEEFSMTDEIYQSILEVSDVCIDYCNGILEVFGLEKKIKYSNVDDVKHLFGLKTEQDEERELMDGILGI